MVLGIFGGVGAGKSTVLDILREKYFAYIIEADKVAHQLYQRKEAGYLAIIDILGDSVCREDGELDREKMANILYHHPQLLDRVNQVIHPLVWKKIEEDIARERKEYDLIVVEAALFPKKKLFDVAWYVDTPQNLRCMRLKESRGYTQERIESMIKRQPSKEEYMKFCDQVLYNDGSKKDLEEQIHLRLMEAKS